MIFGVIVSTALSLIVVPLMYQWLAARAGLPGATGQRLERELQAHSAGTTSVAGATPKV